MKQTLFLTDSLGTARGKPSNSIIYYQDTWVSQVEDYLLKKGFKSFALTQMSLDTNKIKELMPVRLSFYNPLIVFLQIGLCDCVPRAMKEKEINLIKSLPNKIGQKMHEIIKKYDAFLRRKRNIAYVSEEQFKDNMDSILECFRDLLVVVVPISPPNKNYKKKIPGIENRIKIYNSILKEKSVGRHFYLHDYYNKASLLAEDIYVSDEHHLNKKGHDLLASHVINFLNMHQM